jgi:dihydropteroate synthase
MLAVDDEYNPRLRVANVADIFAQWKAKSEYAQKSRARVADLRYGEAAAETLDVSGRQAAPLLVLSTAATGERSTRRISRGSPPRMSTPARRSRSSTTGSRPRPIEAIVDQVARACAWLYRQAPALGVDRERIVCAATRRVRT